MNENTRPMKDLSMDERKQILLDYQTMSSKAVKEKWNISNNTLGHIRFFHGESSAKDRGYYHKDLLEGATDPKVEKIREVKMAGGNSAEAAEESGIPLEQVNRIWDSLKPLELSPVDDLQDATSRI